MSSSNSVRPMPISQALLFFGIPMLEFLIIMRVIIPFFDRTGVPPIISFLVLALPHVLFFFGALLAYRLEGHPWQWANLAQRFRLTALKGQDWAWALLASVGNIGLYLGTYTLAFPVLEWLAALIPDPAALGHVLGDGTSFVGYPLSGNFWLLGVYFFFYFFNVMGEELWWRGYILPRQELVHGERTWLVHGLLWAGFHVFTPYNALMVLPGALFVSWIVQRRQNTWIFVLAHAVLNGLAMIRIIVGIMA